MINLGDNMSYTRVKVTNGNPEYWPTGFVGWLDNDSHDKDEIHNDDFSDYWYHNSTPLEPLVQFSTREECVNYTSKTTGDTIDALGVSYDTVNKPSHYNQYGIEAIDGIRAALGPEGFQSYCNGNTLKYLWRWKYKGGLEDLKKAQVYLNWMIESIEGINDHD